MRKSLLLLLSLLGLFDALYLWWVYSTPSRPMVCFGSGCDVVRSSVFAYPLGIPMPVFGVAMYSALVLLIFSESLLRGAARLSRLAVAVITGVGFLFSLYLTGVEAFVLHAYCFWCVVSAITVALMFAFAVLDLMRPLPPPEPDAALAVARKQLGLVILAVIIGTPLFFVLMRMGNKLPPPPAFSADLRSRLVRPDSHMTGNLSAPLTIVEFGDIQCPACGKAEETAREIRRRYGDRVRFVFRHFPLVKIHPYAEEAAEAAECAGEQGKFWEALDRFYEGQNDLREPQLIIYAGEIGLDMTKLRQCLARNSEAARVARDAADAQALGIRATPTFYVGSQVVEGPLTVEQFSRIVDQELARVGSATPQTTASVPSDPSASASGSGSTGSFGGSPFTPQLGGSSEGCSEAEAQKQQATVINTPEAKKLFESTPQAMFVDVRDAKEFEAARIRGAVNIPSDKISDGMNQLPKDKTIVFYESGRGTGDVCAAGRAAGRKLISSGFSPERVKVYQDGLAGWEKAGLPVER